MNSTLRFLIIVCWLAMPFVVEAQRPNKTSGSLVKVRKGNSFLDKQFWLGIKGGVNFTKAAVDQTYSILTLPPNVVAPEKKYSNFRNAGSQAAIEVTFYYKGFSFSLQPGYQHSSFEYSSQYDWVDFTTPTNRLELRYQHVQNVDHLTLPLLVKYDLYGNKLRPFVQAGVFYSRLLNANKEVVVNGTDFASGGANQFNDATVMVGAEDLFARNYWGVMAGAGVNYNLGNVRLVLDAQYKMGLSLANATSNRYSNDRLSGIADVFDDFTLDNIVVSVGCLFPMRYLASGFKTLDR